MELTSERFEALFREHYEGLGRYAFTMVRDQSVAEDIVQKLFVKIWEKRKELQITEMKAYLYRSVYNFSINELKKIKLMHQHLKQEGESIAVTDADPSHEMHRDELQEKINSAIEELPAKCKEVFRLSRFEDLSYKEISARLDISVKTVENHMGKALSFLRTELKDYLTELVVILLLMSKW